MSWPDNRGDFRGVGAFLEPAAGGFAAEIVETQAGDTSPAQGSCSEWGIVPVYFCLRSVPRGTRFIHYLWRLGESGLLGPAPWQRASARAGVADVHIHDLRHTAATRFTLELNGNLPVLKIITGHKTYSQLNRYINVKPEDVSRLLHGRPLTESDAPAGLPLPSPPQGGPAAAPVQPQQERLPDNVIPLFRKVP